MCRTPDVKLLLAGSRSFESKGKFELPVLQGNLLSIYPGETLLIEATVEGGRIMLERAVATNDKPERTIQFTFKQLPGKLDMLLEIKNPLPAGVRFRMGFMRPSSGDIHSTSSCPVQPGLTGYEHWPFPIYQLVLTDATVVAPSEPMVCK
jgi:hypothetical protein